MKGGRPVATIARRPRSASSDRGSSEPASAARTLGRPPAPSRDPRTRFRAGSSLLMTGNLLAEAGVESGRRHARTSLDTLRNRTLESGSFRHLPKDGGESEAPHAETAIRGPHRIRIRSPTRPTAPRRCRSRSRSTRSCWSSWWWFRSSMSRSCRSRPSAVRAFFVEPHLRRHRPRRRLRPRPRRRTPQARSSSPSTNEPPKFVAPVEVPEQIAPESGHRPRASRAAWPAASRAAFRAAWSGGVVGGLPDAPPPRAGRTRRRADQGAEEAQGREPSYPDIAKQARVQGVVILECTISPQGKVTDVKVLRGIPLLDAAAIEAVKQWVYSPDPAERRARPRHHDRDRELQALRRRRKPETRIPSRRITSMGFDLTEHVRAHGTVSRGASSSRCCIMSIISIGIMIERWYTYQQATKQSRKYAPEVAAPAEAGQDQGGHRRLHAATRSSTRTWPRCWWSACRNGSTSRRRARRSGTRKRAVDARQARHPARHRRQPRRPQARPLRPGHHRLHRALRRPLRHHLRHHQRVLGHGPHRLGRHRRHLRRHRRGPHHHRLRPVRGGARGLGVQLPRPAASKGFNVEMDNSSSELLDYFIKKGA